MSFFKKTLQALGFGKDSNQEDYTYTAKDISVATNRASQPDSHNEASDNTAQDEPVQNMPHELLDKIVELINAQYPDFVKQSIDIAREKTFLAEQLGDSLTRYVNELTTRLTARSQQEVAASRQQLERDMETLKQKTAELEKQKAEIHSAQLSAERQKRALTDKVHDLESRVATLEADKEQYELENKSLLNKLKVSEVRQGEVDEAQAEINRLLETIQEMRKNSAPSQETLDQLAEKDASIEALQERIKYLSSQIDELNQEKTSLNEQIADHRNTADNQERLITQLTGEIATFVAQQEDNEKQLAETLKLHNELQELQASLDERIARCNQLENTIAELRAGEQDNRMAAENASQLLADALNANSRLQQEHDATRALLAEKETLIANQLNEVERLSTQLAQVTASATTLQAQLQEAEKKTETSGSEIAELQTQLQEALQKSETSGSEIAELQAQLQQATQKANQANEQLVQLETQHAEQVKNLQQEIESQQQHAITLEKQLVEVQLQAANATKQPTGATSEELERANTMIAALKKQRQELISQTATLRTQNKNYENQIATLESRLSNIASQTDGDNFDASTAIDEALNWMMPVLPHQLEEEARRREEEERREKEENEREKQAEKERRTSRDDSSQMSLW